MADSINHRIRQIVIETRVVTTLAGSGEEGDADGTGEEARFDYPSSVATSPDGTFLFVSESQSRHDMMRGSSPTGGRRIRQVAVADGTVTTIAVGTSSGASFDDPWGVAVSTDGKRLFVADKNKNRISQIHA